MNELCAPPTDYVIESSHHQQPVLAVIIDAEEEFDWAQPISEKNTSVASMGNQWGAQAIHEAYGFKPIYLIDYPVASQANGYRELRDWVLSDRCEVGAQLHSWVTPPFVTGNLPHASYQFNLEPEIELKKLSHLTETIEMNLGVRPLVHRAGRFGVGQRTAGYLKKLGFVVDCSVATSSDYRDEGGPDFRDFPATPFWLDGTLRSLLEVPVTAGIVGSRAHLLRSNFLYETGNPLSKRIIRSGLSRLRLAEQIRLTPEGVSVTEAKRLVLGMLKAGTRTFTLTYHSPSLVPGNTPYVRTQRELGKFLDWFKAFYDFFLGEVGGAPTTCLQIYQKARDCHAR